MIVRIYHKEQARVSRTIAAVAIVLLALFAYIEFSNSSYLSGKTLINRFDVGDAVTIRSGDLEGLQGKVAGVERKGNDVFLSVDLRTQDEPVRINAADVEQRTPKRLFGALESWGQVVGIVIVVGFVIGGYVLLNRPRIVDFFSAVETEVRKVNWPTKHQVLGSALVVIITMLALAGYLFAVDTGLTYILRLFLHSG